MITALEAFKVANAGKEAAHNKELKEAVPNMLDQIEEKIRQCMVKHAFYCDFIIEKGEFEFLSEVLNTLVANLEYDGYVARIDDESYDKVSLFISWANPKGHELLK